ncbi:MAG TPA: hypothetical protein PKJ10_02965 [Smithella sp.]|nr:hypothetical protein [Smithella sp.]
MSHIFSVMKKAVRNLNTEGNLPVTEKQPRENVWCNKYGYFIDLDACRARSLQNKTCRRCFASLIQVPLPF